MAINTVQKKGNQGKDAGSTGCPGWYKLICVVTNWVNSEQSLEDLRIGTWWSPVEEHFRQREQTWQSPMVAEKEMATHSSLLAWRIPWTEEPGRPWCMGSRRVGHDWATSLTHSLTHSWQPAPWQADSKDGMIREEGARRKMSWRRSSRSVLTGKHIQRLSTAFTEFEILTRHPNRDDKHWVYV